LASLAAILKQSQTTFRGSNELAEADEPVLPDLHLIHNPEELRQHGEKHLGYCFVTFPTVREAKRAIVFAHNHFDLAAEQTAEDRPKVGLLNEDYHMDFDEAFKSDYLKSLYISNQLRDQQKTLLLQSLEKEEE